VNLPSLPPPFEMLVDPKTGVINEVWYRWFSTFSSFIYEEGTWTPAYDAEAGLFASITYDAARWGNYVKVGNMVAIQCRLATDAFSVGTATGGLYIDGLPYPARTLSSGFQSLAVGFAQSFVGEEPISALIPSGADHIELYYRATVDGNSAQSDVSDLDTGTNDNLIYVGGTYFI
jgi:hypothetical protein